MLSDLLSLEHLFGQENAALNIEDLLNRYGSDSVGDAIERGDIIRHRVCIGPDCGRDVCWLSENGRCKAAQFLYQGAVPCAQELVESR